jgi:hypothetical protein
LIGTLVGSIEAPRALDQSPDLDRFLQLPKAQRLGPGDPWCHRVGQPIGR